MWSNLYYRFWICILLCCTHVEAGAQVTVGPGLSPTGGVAVYGAEERTSILLQSFRAPGDGYRLEGLSVLLNNATREEGMAFTIVVGEWIYTPEAYWDERYNLGDILWSQAGNVSFSPFERLRFDFNVGGIPLDGDRAYAFGIYDLKGLGVGGFYSQDMYEDGFSYSASAESLYVPGVSNIVGSAESGGFKDIAFVAEFSGGPAIPEPSATALVFALGALGYCMVRRFSRRTIP